MLNGYKNREQFKLVFSSTRIQRSTDVMSALSKLFGYTARCCPLLVKWRGDWPDRLRVRAHVWQRCLSPCPSCCRRWLAAQRCGAFTAASPSASFRGCPSQLKIGRLRPAADGLTFGLELFVRSGRKWLPWERAGESGQDCPPHHTIHRKLS